MLFVLQQIVQNVVRNAQEAYVAFIDFTAAFDSVSHKFLDQCLKQMEASDSSRVTFRAIYKNAKGSVWIRNSDGTYTYSDAFEICRGVVQGDIFSPYCLIVALAVLMMQYDPIRYEDSSIILMA